MIVIFATIYGKEGKKMKFDKITVIVGVLSQIFLLATAAGATDFGDASDESINKFISANVDWISANEVNADSSELIVAQNDETTESYDSTEEFYFGPDEDKVRAEIEKKNSTLDPVARAHRDMKLYIGATLIATAVTMFVLGLLHTKKELPKDYYTGKRKYEEVYGEDNPIQLNVIKEPYVPSIVAGISLAVGSVFLMLKK